MKVMISVGLPFFLLLGCLSSLKATVVVIDDFSSSPYDIGTSMLSADISPISSTIAEARWVNGNGTQTWSSSVNVDAGELLYSVFGAPGPGQRLSINYSNDVGNLNLIGFSHFVLDVENISGAADIYVLFRGAHDRFSPEIPAAMNASGRFYIPFSNMGVEDPFAPSSVVFRIFPTSEDFSVAFSSVGVIPEPSSVLMIAFGMFALFLRRRGEP